MTKAPNYLSKKSQEFFNETAGNYDLEAHHIKTLILACECLDLIEKARKEVEKTGAFYPDRFGHTKSNPALNVIRDQKTLFARLIRELALDLEPSKEPGRPPRQY